MQSLRKLGFQNRDAKKHGPVEICAGDFAALQLFIRYPFSLQLVSTSGPWSPITSQFFIQRLSKGSFIQGNYKLNSQLLISLVNVQSSLSLDSDLK